MEISLLADTVAVCTAKQGIAFGKSLLKRWDLVNNNSFADSSVDQSQVSTFIFAIDAPVRSSSYKTIRRIRKKRRTKRALFGGDSDDGGDLGRFLLEGDFGGNDGGGGGKGWNSGGGGGFGNENWEEASSWSDPAMGFVYEVIYWIVLSNCVHFAFKRIMRIVTDGEREKLNITLSPV